MNDSVALNTPSSSSSSSSSTTTAQTQEQEGQTSNSNGVMVAGLKTRYCYFCILVVVALSVGATFSLLFWSEEELSLSMINEETLTDRGVVVVVVEAKEEEDEEGEAETRDGSTYYSANYNDSSSSITSTAGTAAASSSSSSWWMPKEGDLEFCKSHNIILPRSGLVVDNNASSGMEVPYSLGMIDFRPHPENVAICSTLNETLHAIRFGRRRVTFQKKEDKEQDGKGYETNNVTTTKTTHQSPLPLSTSVFVPAGCDIPILSPDRVCEVLNRFSRIILVGDSLTRHLQYALRISLSNDFRLGGVLTRGCSNETLQNCQCDGQFSGADICRQVPPSFRSITPTAVASTSMDSSNNKLEYAICPNLKRGASSKKSSDGSDSFFEEYLAVNMDSPESAERFAKSSFGMTTCNHDHNNNINNNYSKNKPDPYARGVLLVLQGGLHADMDPLLFQQQFIARVWENAALQCRDKLYVIWLSHGSQSEQATEKYPRQGETNAMIFNADMESYLHKYFTNNIPPLASQNSGNNNNNTVVVIDWMNLTKGAPMISDGVHFSTSVNYFKIQYILNVANQMKDEDVYMSLKPPKPKT